MIFGIGTDIVSIARMSEALGRHGEHFAEHILADGEMADFRAARDQARFLAKRFAAKEAFAKAYGTGLRTPVTLGSLAVAHDELGKPYFTFDAELENILRERQLQAQLSLSDERDYVVAFALIEVRA